MTAPEPLFGKNLGQPLDSFEAPAWSAPPRELAFGGWMPAIAERQQLQPATVRLASADASFRRYFRVDGSAGGPTRIVMDAPPAQENCAPLVRIGGLLAG